MPRLSITEWIAEQDRYALDEGRILRLFERELHGPS